MVKIGIDARLYNQTGVGTYIKNLLFYLDDYLIKNKNSNFFFYVYFLEKDFNQVNFKSNKIIKKKANFKWHSFSEQINFLFILLKDKLDLVHFTYFTFPIFYFRKYILTIHDLTPLFFKTGKASTKNIFIYYFKHFVFKILFFFSVLRASTIITPTFTVKNQLTNYFKFIPNLSKKIKVIYEGVSFEILKPKIIDNNFSKKFKKFFVYIGNFYPHKNVENLIKAFLMLRNKNYQLVLIGPDDYFSKRIENKFGDKIFKNGNIFLLKNLKREEINWFYKNCQALIHPSFSEGFGLTLLEAAYFKKPIIASDIDVFKELWGENYISFNPYSISDITKKIYFFIKKKPNFDYKKIIENYSFEKMFKKTLDLYFLFIKSKNEL